jgi:4'-phosphopantetheinyl transferase
VDDGHGVAWRRSTVHHRAEVAGARRAEPWRVTAGWPAGPDGRVLAPGEVHVWRVPLAQPAAEIERLGRTLSSDERTRAARFHFERDRRTFTVVRGALRTLLGRYLAHAPDALAFGYGAKGKPYLTAPAAAAVRFNVSHAGDLGLLAFARDRELGVDVEQRRALADLLSLAAASFSSAELAALRALPAAVHSEAFYLCWSRKEAFIKATGEGISQLDAFDVSLAPGDPARLLAIRGAAAHTAWSMYELPPLDGHAAALVTAGDALAVRCWSWPTAAL